MCVCLALLARMSTRLKIGSRYLKGSGFWSIRFDFCPIVCIVLCDTEIMIELMPVKPHNCNNRECIHYPTTTTYLKWVRAHLNNRTPHTQKYVMWKLWVPAWWMLMMKKATDWSCLHWHRNQFVILFKATWFRFWCVSIRLFLPTTHQLVTITPVRQITCLYSVRKRCSIPFIRCVCAFFTLSLVIVFVVVAVGPCTKMISVTKHVAELCIRYQYMGFLSSLIHCEWPLVLCAFSDKSTLVSGLWMKASWMRIILSILLASHFAPTLLSPLSTLSLGICVLENENVFWIFKHFSFEFCRIQISIFITRPVEYVRNPRTHTKLMLVYIILFFFVSRVCLFVLHIWNMVLELAILSVDDSNERSRDGERPAVAVGKKIGKSDVR